MIDLAKTKRLGFVCLFDFEITFYSLNSSPFLSGKSREKKKRKKKKFFHKKALLVYICFYFLIHNKIYIFNF